MSQIEPTLPPVARGFVRRIVDEVAPTANPAAFLAVLAQVARTFASPPPSARTVASGASPIGADEEPGAALVPGAEPGLPTPARAADPSRDSTTEPATTLPSSFASTRPQAPDPTLAWLATRGEREVKPPLPPLPPIVARPVVGVPHPPPVPAPTPVPEVFVPPPMQALVAPVPSFAPARRNAAPHRPGAPITNRGPLGATARPLPPERVASEPPRGGVTRADARTRGIAPEDAPDRSDSEADRPAPETNATPRLMDAARAGEPQALANGAPAAASRLGASLDTSAGAQVPADHTLADPAFDDPSHAPRTTERVTVSFDSADGGIGRIRLALHGERLRATIVTDSEGEARRLDEELGGLRRSLANHGLANVNVTVQRAAAARPDASSTERERRTPSDDPQHSSRRPRSRSPHSDSGKEDSR